MSGYVRLLSRISHRRDRWPIAINHRTKACINPVRKSPVARGTLIVKIVFEHFDASLQPLPRRVKAFVNRGNGNLQKLADVSLRIAVNVKECGYEAFFVR